MFKPTMICAGSSIDGRGFCGGDPGGPAVVNGEIVGIAAWYRRCTSTHYSGMYTRASHSVHQLPYQHKKLIKKF